MSATIDQKNILTRNLSKNTLPNIGLPRNGLIVSCQPVPGGAMDDVAHVVGFALAALHAGAVGLRIESQRYVRAVRAVTDAPIIGLVKRDLDDSAVRITPFIEDIKDLSEAGADIIAFDATMRVRPTSVEQLAQAIRETGKLSMADCSCLEEARHALELGVDFVGTTLAGYTGGPEPTQPDLALVGAMRQLTPHVIAEGCIRTPQQALQAAQAGAAFVVVGSAITRPEHITNWFCTALDKVYRPDSAPIVLAIDLGGTKTMAALIQSGQLVEKIQFNTDRTAKAEKWLGDIATQTSHWRGRYQTVGIGVTGAVRNGIWQAMNQKTLNIEQPFALIDYATQLFHVPVFAANDAQAAAWGEYQANPTEGNLVFITLSTGLGGGIVANGQLLSGIAGHFGQIREQKNQPFENHLSGQWIAAQARHLGFDMTAKDVFLAARQQEQWACDIINDMATRFAQFCCNIQLMLDPARIVVGGGVGLATGFINKTQAAIEALNPPIIPRLESARLASEAGIFGIADLAARQEMAG